MWLLDTNTISELIRPNPNPTALAWLHEHSPEDHFVSAITIGEIKFGIERLKPSKKQAHLLRWLEEELIPTYSACKSVGS